MATYAEFTFQINAHPNQETLNMLMAELIELGFESFLEPEIALGKKATLQAYVKQDKVSLESLNTLLQKRYLFSHHITYTHSKIEEKNWNKEWESHFNPVLIDKRVLVSAPFHHADPTVKYEIIIAPKMSFGTGHHPTTALMMGDMLGTDFSDKKVLDFGCGTGILGILASKLGARNITALDTDEWAFLNAPENFRLNHCSNIKPIHGSLHELNSSDFDIILANINLNVITSTLSIINKLLRQNGVYFISGFYEKDLNTISKKMKNYNFDLANKKISHHWCEARLIKKGM